jgi:hypothetical protein
MEGNMRRIRLVFSFLALAGSNHLLAQNPDSTPLAPQSARQALIEMFLGKGDNDFARHLPEAARQALIHKGDSQENSVLLRISAIGRQIGSQGEHLETFDEGGTLLVSEQNGGHEKFELLVEHDSLLGDAEEIELSVQYYKDRQRQSLSLVPRLIFTFKQEVEIWRLTEVTAAAHVPLNDPDYLKGLRKQQDEANESAAQNRVKTIAIAERAYASRHPDRGYACTLATLFSSDPNATPGENSFVYDPGQEKEQWSGYRFALSGCDGTPASKYRITAMPVDSDGDIKMFCADDSGTVKAFSGTRSSSCFSRGEAINTGINPSDDTD